MVNKKYTYPLQYSKTYQTIILLNIKRIVILYYWVHQTHKQAIKVGLPSLITFYQKKIFSWKQGTNMFTTSTSY